MKTSLSLFLTIILSINSYCQGLTSDYRTLPINKAIKSFPDIFDLSTPLKSCISFNYILVKGKDCLLSTASTERYKSILPDSTVSDSKVSEAYKNSVLNSIVREVVYYKDSVACVIVQRKDSLFSIRTFNLEKGKWVNNGEDERKSIVSSRKQFANYAKEQLCGLRRINVLSKIPSDTLSFINYLKNSGQEPMQFVLNELTNHKIVLYGEIHYRALSWEFCKNLILDPNFPKKAGTVFLELPSHKQGQIDKFLAGKTMDQELILDVLRDMMDRGWPVKGMFEFILDIWKINQSLSAKEKVKILAVDIPRPYSTFKTHEDYRKFFDTIMDRNLYMASTIEKYISLKTDDRNTLFIVGAGHVYKSAESAGELLTKKYKDGEVFTIFTHCPIIDNSGNMPGRIRNGIFDYSFYMNGNKPIAFVLKNSPWGKEPFDGLLDVSYNCNVGSFADNYDGYIFLGQLDIELSDGVLYELYSDDFVAELNRRAKIEGSTIQEWYGIKEATKEEVIASIKAGEDKYRWANKLPPLIKYQVKNN